MTQVFDPETGVVTAGDGDRGRAVPGRPGEDGRDGRLRRGPARVRRGGRAEALEGRARPPREGRRRAAPPARRVPRPPELTPGETVTVEAFEPGDTSRSPASRSARASPGRSSGTTSSRGPKTHGSHNIRKPGSVGASATPSRVFKGMRMAGRMGGKRVTQVGLVVHEVDPERTSCSSRARFPARRTASSRSGRRRLIPATTAK